MKKLLGLLLILSSLIMACASPTHYYTSGIEAFNDENYAKAVSAYSRWLWETPSNVDSVNFIYRFQVYYRRGQAYLHMGKPEKAAEDYMESLRLIERMGYPRSHQDLKGAYFNTKQGLAHASVPANAFRAHARGRTAYNNKEYDLAIEEFTRAINLASDYAYAYHNRGLSYFMKGAGFFEQSKTDITEAVRLKIQLNQEFALPDSFTQLGHIYRIQGDYNNALSYYNRALQIDNTHASAQRYKNVTLAQLEYRLATSSMDRGDYTTAINQYRNVLKLNPDHTDAKNNLEVAWNRRIEANPNLYPAPFQGQWMFYSPPQFIPGTSSRTDTYFETVPYTDANGRRATRTETRTYTTPGTPATTRPAHKEVYEFNGSNYILYVDDRVRSSGTFYYNGNTIELNNGTILQYVNNTITGGDMRFVKQ